jgi:hypothetical protein
MLGAAFVLSFAALFVNPVGSRLLLYPLDVMLNQKGLAHIAEWQAVQFNDLRACASIGLAGCVLLAALIKRSELHLEELALLIVGFGMAARHQRMLFVFGILAAPVVCRLLSDAWDRYDARRDRWGPNAVMMALSVSLMIWAFPSRKELDLQVSKANPVRAVDFIRRSGLSGRMLNEYVFGGYLIWAAPEHPVFVDGRGDIFDWTGVLADYGKWAQLQSDPNMLLKRYRIDFCLLSRESPMVHVLPLLPGWQQVYSDDVSVIFSQAKNVHNEDLSRYRPS